MHETGLIGIAVEAKAITDGQIWENDKYVLKVESINGMKQAIIFTKTDKGLRFFQYIWKEDAYLKVLIRMTGLSLTTKRLSVEESPS